MDVEDEKKPFDAETAQDDDAQPDPDEQLMLDQGNGRMWLVKVSLGPAAMTRFHASTSCCPSRSPSSSWSAGAP